LASSLDPANVRDTFKRTALRLAKLLAQKYPSLAYLVEEASKDDLETLATVEEEIEYVHNVDAHND